VSVVVLHFVSGGGLNVQPLHCMRPLTCFQLSANSLFILNSGSYPNSVGVLIEPPFLAWLCAYTVFLQKENDNECVVLLDHFLELCKLFRFIFYHQIIDG